MAGTWRWSAGDSYAQRMAEYLDETALNIFTDGSAYHGPRVGGTGVLVVWVDEAGTEQVDSFESPAYGGATNNQMELEACIEALKIVTTRRSPYDLTTYRKVVIHSDAMYVVENFPRAKSVWPAAKWLRADGNPVENTRQWKELMRLARRLRERGPWLEIKWVKGKKSPRTKAVDKAAKRSAKSPVQRTANVVTVRRKLTDKPVERGSVRMEGQRLTIRIFTAEYQATQKLHKYGYEVMSEKSAYRGCADIIYSDIVLRPNHAFYVRVNSDTSKPRIVKCFRQTDAS